MNDILRSMFNCWQLSLWLSEATEENTNKSRQTLRPLGHAELIYRRQSSHAALATTLPARCSLTWKTDTGSRCTVPADCWAVYSCCSLFAAGSAMHRAPQPASRNVCCLTFVCG